MNNLLYDFNGSVGRDRKHEAMMNTLNERDNFLAKLNESRASREQDSREKTAAQKIQALYRKYAARVKCHQKLREEFEGIASVGTPAALVTMARQLNMFYDPKCANDNERLTNLCGQLVTLGRTSGPSFLPDNTRRFLCLNILSFLRHADKTTLFTMPVRFFEVFCPPGEYPYFVQRGWFAAILSLIANCSPDSNVSEIQSHLPGRLQTLCELLMAPFKSAENKVLLLTQLFRDLFGNPSPNVMYVVALPFILRCRDTLFTTEQIIQAVDAAVVDGTNKIASLLKCHAIVQLFAGDGPVTGDLSRQLINSLATAATHCLPKEPDVSQTGFSAQLDQGLRSFLFSATFISLFASAINSPFSDVKTIVSMQAMLDSNAILETMATTHFFLERLYSYTTNMKGKSAGFGRSSDVETHMTKLRHGQKISEEQRAEFLPALSLLCAVIRKIIEFYSDDDVMNSPQIADVLRTVVSATKALRDMTLGLIDLAFPEDFWSFRIPAEQRKRDAAVWGAAYDDLVKTLQTVHHKNGRVKFLPDEFWTDHRRPVVVSKTTWTPAGRRGGRGRRGQQHNLPFSFVRYLHRGERAHDENMSGSDSDMEVDEDLPPNTADLRNLSIVREIPFVLSFDQRLKIFNELLAHDKEENGVLVDPYGLRSSGINVSVRRGSLYDDAFIAFSPGQVPNMKLPMKIHMINWAGMNEPGVDGGGIFREFLSEVLKTGLDPERGLFCYTHDRLLYPNPTAKVAFFDNYSQHFYFLGRMVAKLIYEGMMLDVRFADFFLIQLLGSRVTNIELDQMKSYDPVHYKNLRDLLSMSEAQLAELGLDFSVITDELGCVKTVDLKPNGSNILVTTQNLREYIQLRVNYFLYKRIMPMVDAMRAGVSDVMEPSWLGMFDPSEIQKIVSGIDADIDVNDMKRHCEVYNANDQADKVYIETFWQVVRGFTPEDKAALLKFITGCPRPPINGFSTLAPNMGIQLIHDDSLLPMSATCMNMFKLPKYDSIATLTEKLRYAIHSGAGFELA